MYLYHFVPEDQVGDVVYPLNVLREKHPEIYAKQYAKYDSIQEKDVEIPGFGYWNDCVNLMPVNPGLVKQELEYFGHNTQWAWRFYKIDADTLDQSNMIILISLDGADPSKRKFIPFNKANFDEYCKIGEPTRYRYQKAKDQDEQPMTFAGVPHVLYKGYVNTQNLELVEF